MPLWVLLLVLGVILGSWLMVRPSKRERQLARLRAVATSQGFHVLLPSRVKAMYKALDGIPDGAFLYYKTWSGSRKPPVQVTLVSSEALVESESPASSHKEQEPEFDQQKLPDHLAQNSQKFVRDYRSVVKAVLIEQSLIGFFWDESGSEESLEQMLLQFTDLQKFIEEQLIKNN